MTVGFEKHADSTLRVFSCFPDLGIYALVAWLTDSKFSLDLGLASRTCADDGALGKRRKAYAEPAILNAY